MGECQPHQISEIVIPLEKLGEKDVPYGLKSAHSKGNRLQDIFSEEFLEGRTGNMP